MKTKYEQFKSGGIYGAHQKVFDNHFEDFITWIMKPSPVDKLKKVEAIVAFSFGYGPGKFDFKNKIHQYNPREYYPGMVNERLADKMQQFWVGTENLCKLDGIYAQWEIAEAFAGIYKYEKELKNIAKPIGDTYLSTKGVADYFVDNGLTKHKNIAVFAQPFHMYRCAKTLEKSLRDVGSNANVLIADTRDVPFDKNSEQKWTTHVELYIPYELRSRALARYLGHM